MTASLASLALLCPASAYADQVHDALDAYALYQNDVSALLDADVASGRVVDAALARISRHSYGSVARGWIAYSALTAAQSPEFAAGVQRTIRDDGRAAVLRQLRSDLGYARRQSGSAQAIRLVLDAANADGARAALAGAPYDRFARAGAPHVQAVSSVIRVDLGGARLTPDMLARLHVGALAGQPMRDASAFGGRDFWDSLAGREVRRTGSRGGHERPVYAPVTDHILTLSALLVADATGGERQRVNELLDEPITEQCLQMQHLELRQCLSVSHDASERAYCLNQHGLSGPGSCFSAMSR